MPERIKEQLVDLKEKREMNGISQRRLIDESGLGERTIRNLESGKSAKVSTCSRCENALNALLAADGNESVTLTRSRVVTLTTERLPKGNYPKGNTNKARAARKRQGAKRRNQE